MAKPLKFNKPQKSVEKAQDDAKKPLAKPLKLNKESELDKQQKTTSDKPLATPLKLKQQKQTSDLVKSPQMVKTPTESKTVKNVNTPSSSPQQTTESTHYHDIAKLPIPLPNLPLPSNEQ